ncbi:MAG: YraN family protein [Chloroflexota bacterium]|nr:YraN family protein [Chloroflexota bacterium]
MSSPRRDLGAFGERLAAAHLEAKGYRIRARNFRCREGEIDIVAEDSDCLVFVEVRTRRGNALGSAVESVTPAKQRRLLSLAQAYTQARDDLPPQQRIDVITLDLSPDGRLLSLRHIEGAIADGESP